jgi:hypothetical protein
MRSPGWTTDQRAVELAFKFAGEPLPEEQIAKILEEAEPLPPPPGSGQAPVEEAEEAGGEEVGDE